MGIVRHIALTAAVLFATPALSQEVIEIGSGLSAESHFGQGMSRFEEVLAEKSGGKFQVQHHLLGSVGSEREMIEAVQTGTLDMVIAGVGTLPNFVPATQIFDMPFLFRDYDHADAVLDGPIGDGLLKIVDEAGFKALAWSETGLRHLSNSVKPVSSPADLEGLKIRTQENPVHLAFFRALGAAPTPMAWPEVFTALQQGLIDGQENPANVVLLAKLYEVQNHLSLTGHLYAPAIILMSQDRWSQLSSEEQAWFEEAADEAVKVTRSVGREQESEAVDKLRGLGMEIVTDVDQAAFQNAAGSVYETYVDKFGDELIEQIRETR